MKRKAYRRVVRAAAKKARSLIGKYRRNKISRSRIGKKRLDVHHFKRISRPRQLVLQTGAETFYAESATFGTFVTTPSDFTPLFDQYRINKIVYKMRLRFDPSAQAPSNAIYPKLYIAADYDDDVTPTSIMQLLERSNTKMHVMKPNYEATFVLTPAILNEVYRSATGTSYSPQWKKWLDMSYIDVPHYGVKMCIEDMPVAGYYMTITTTTYFSCKNVR